MQTIRKDLHYLSERGIAQRAYGGAILADSVNLTNEPALDAKRVVNTDEKVRIGRAAAAMVAPGDSIVLDSGTTALQIALHLPDIDDITVVTNDFDILSALAQRHHLKVMMLGGALRRKNMAFYGAQTMSALDDLHVDKLFLGVDGFDVERGITTHFEQEAMLNRKMVEAARRVIVVTDRSKFGQTCLHRIISLAEIDELVTDGVHLPDDIAAAADRFNFVITQA